MFLGRLGWLVCAAAVCVPLIVQADVRPVSGSLSVSLDYVAAAGCPGIASFKDVVIRRLGYDPFREDAPDRILVRIMTTGHVAEGHVEWRDATGKWVGDRTFPFRGDDCGDLARAMGFALAVQIQLLAIAGAPPASSPATPAEPIPPVSVSLSPSASAPASSLVHESAPVVTEVAVKETQTGGIRPTFTIGAGASTGFGWSSRTTWLAGLGGRVVWPHLMLEVAAEVSLPTITRRADGAGYSQQEVLVSAAACRPHERWSACWLVKAGSIRVAGEDIDLPTSASAFIVATGLRLSVTQPLGRHLYVSARADGVALLKRWTVTLDGRPVWTSPRVAETIGIDAGVRFP